MMAGSDHFSFAVPSDSWVIFLGVGALLPLMLAWVLPRRLAWGAFGVLVHPAIALAGLRLFSETLSPLRWMFYLPAGLALAWSTVQLIARGGAGSARGGGEATHGDCLAGVCDAAGAVTGVLTLVMLVCVVLWGGLDVFAAVRSRPAVDAERVWGLWGDVPWVVGIMSSAVLLRLWATGDGRLAALLFVLFAGAALWMGLGGPGLVGGRFGSGSASNWVGSRGLLMGWSVVLSGFVVAHGWLRRRAFWGLVRSDPEALLGTVGEWPGFRKAAGVVSVLLVLLVCYELASAGGSGDRGWAVWVFVFAGVGGVSTFSLLGQRWSVNLAEVAMGLVTLSVAALVVSALPAEPRHPAGRYPMLFNALMIGFALMTGFWVWIGKVWEQQLDGGEAWTSAGRVARLCPGFAFFVALLGLVNGSLMAVWPRLRGVGVYDDSLGRMSAAVAGHLFLLLVVLWSGRRTSRSGFDALALLVGISLAGFIAVRAGPLSSRVHEGAPIEALGMTASEGAAG